MMKGNGMNRERGDASVEMGPETKLGAAFGALLSSGKTAAAAAALNGDFRKAGRMRALPDGERSVLLMARDDSSPQGDTGWTRPIGRLVGNGPRVIVHSEGGIRVRKLANSLDEQVSLASLSITETAVHGDRVRAWMSHIVDFEHQPTPEAKERLGKIGQFSSGLYGLRALRDVLGPNDLVREVNAVCARRGLIATLNEERTELLIADQPSATNIARVSLVDGEVKALAHIAKRLAERIVRAAVISADAKLDLLGQVQERRKANKSERDAEQKRLDEQLEAQRERARKELLARHHLKEGEEFCVRDPGCGNDVTYIALRDLAPEDLVLVIGGENPCRLGMAVLAPEVKTFTVNDSARWHLADAIVTEAHRSDEEPALR